ncbi:hypothetical protein TNCV_4685121 [Trichonephila clavipes]|nr:hypothetical protein TNCV_4685121 [Trichonephila clavipes]
MAEEKDRASFLMEVEDECSLDTPQRKLTLFGTVEFQLNKPRHWERGRKEITQKIFERGLDFKVVEHVMSFEATIICALYSNGD